MESSAFTLSCGCRLYPVPKIFSSPQKETPHTLSTYSPFFPPLSSSVYFLFLWVYLPWIFHMNRTTQNVTFCVLLSLSIMFFRFTFKHESVCFIPFAWLNNIPLCGYTTICLPTLFLHQGPGDQGKPGGARPSHHDGGYDNAAGEWLWQIQDAWWQELHQKLKPWPAQSVRWSKSHQKGERASTALPSMTLPSTALPSVALPSTGELHHGNQGERLWACYLDILLRQGVTEKFSEVTFSCYNCGIDGYYGSIKNLYSPPWYRAVAEKQLRSRRLTTFPRLLTDSLLNGATW